LSGQVHVTPKSTQNCSFVKRSETQAPPGQSRWSTQGSQPLPLPWQLPNRCEQVGTPMASSVARQVVEAPHGHELMLSSQRTVQIFSPERSFAQSWLRTPKQSTSLSHGAQNSRRRQIWVVSVRELPLRIVEQKNPVGHSSFAAHPSFVQ
jgi:hypothetical protein